MKSSYQWNKGGFMTRSNLGLVLTAVAALSIASGCAKKKVAAATPPAPPTATAETRRPEPAPTRTEAAAPVRTPEPAPRSTMPDAATRAHIDQLLAKIEDAYFDYDRHTLRPDAIEALKSDSSELRDILKDYPEYRLTIEGHCDERGSAEYNIALGQARADSAKAYLVGVGIPSGQLGTVSYGKEKPACQDHEENCWQKNRRIHIVALAK
jgi:peptidoglycan-associated lipoprotein